MISSGYFLKFSMSKGLYHLTHLQNLPNILQHQQLKCQNLLTSAGVQHVNIAHQEIKTRRAGLAVPIAPGGVLNDYVPFYFAPRSPMLYAIHCNNVNGYNEGQNPLIYLFATVETISKTHKLFVFTDGHPTISYSNFYNDPADLIHIDWNIMKARYWHDTDQEPDRKRRRQAEFLVYQTVSWASFLGIGVINTNMKARVEEILSNAQQNIEVKVKTEWFYD